MKYFLLSSPFYLSKGWVRRPADVQCTQNRIVTAVGPEVKRLKVGGRVFGFTWRNQKEKAHQEVVCAPENLLGVVPEGVSCKSNLFWSYYSLVCMKCASYFYLGNH